MLVARLPEGDGATGGFADEPSALRKSSSFGFGVGVNECFTLEDFLAVTGSLVGKLTTRSGTAYGGTPAGNPALGALLPILGASGGPGRATASTEPEPAASGPLLSGDRRSTRMAIPST